MTNPRSVFDDGVLFLTFWLSRSLAYMTDNFFKCRAQSLYLIIRFLPVFDCGEDGVEVGPSWPHSFVKALMNTSFCRANLYEVNKHRRNS